jgi:Holliday junction DNA helicase RuvB
MANSVKLVLDLLWQKTFHGGSNRCSFEEIIGHADIKRILTKAILSKRPVHILMVGSPASAKTMFLTEIMQRFKSSLFVVGSNTTKAGLVNQLFERGPKFLLIDELEKMNSNDQSSLLHLMETGIISETKINKTRQMELTSWVFATANSCQKIIEPLLSRFLVLEIPEYTFEQFTEIAVSRLAKEKLDKYIASVIAENVWNELESKDIRDVVKVARLTETVEDIPFIIRMMKRRQ